MSMNQERLGRASDPDVWVDHTITKKKDTINTYEKYLFGTGLYKKYYEESQPFFNIFISLRDYLCE
jgi:hypothetical protein